MAKPVPEIRTLLALVALLLVVAPAGAARAQAPPQLESFTINAPLVDFLHTVVGGETFTVTLRLDRPAPAGGTRVRVSKLRDSGPIYTLPKEAVIPEGGRSRTFTVETLPIAPGDITPSNQQLAGSIVSVEHPDVLFGSVFIVPRPRDDPRGDPVTYEAEKAILPAPAWSRRRAVEPSLERGFRRLHLANGLGHVRRSGPRRHEPCRLPLRVHGLRAETDAGHDQRHRPPGHLLADPRARAGTSSGRSRRRSCPARTRSGWRPCGEASRST
jgi:hypothetical protein